MRVGAPRRNTAPGIACRGPAAPAPAALASERRAAALPFLPTLGTALVLALASFYCTHTGLPPSLPAGPAATSAGALAATLTPAAMPVATMAPAGLGVPPADGPTPYPVRGAEGVHAALAFARLPPPLIPSVAADAPAPVRVRPTHLAAQPAPRRPCPAGRCGDPVRSGAAAGPARAASEPVLAPVALAPPALAPPALAPPGPSEEALPEDALPFADTAATWIGRVSSLGGGLGRDAVAFGGGLGRDAVAFGGAVTGLLDPAP